MRAILLITIFLLGGCGTVNDPHVYAPLAAAALLQINNADEKVSDYLYENNPVFGDVENAKDWSDNFRSYTETSYILAGLFADIRADHKALLLTSQYVSGEAVSEVRSEIWRHVERDRPDGSGNTSMPSGHTTTASYRAKLAKINTQYLDVNEDIKDNLNIMYTSFAAMTGYARVEAGRHYPSDVLVGYALGSFLGNITEQVVIFSPLASRDGVMLNVSVLME